MIAMLLGRPGGGKSYESVVFHVLPALMEGRKVITNLPLVFEKIIAICPEAKHLLDFRRRSVDDDTKHAFGHPDDYGDPWRHPETGAGPLYVIDECHKPIPKVGTPKEVEEWYAEHRHETADVLLITQSYGKINRAIVDLVDVVYLVQKATALGSQDKYVRKVKWGVRGETLNTSIRKYEPRYFALYKSHTRGGGKELAASDIRPIWMHWSVIGAGLAFVAAVGIFATSDTSLFPEPKVKPKEDAGYAVLVVDSDAPADPAPPVSSGLPPPPAHDNKPPPKPPPQDVMPQTPFEGLGLHVVGVMELRGQTRYVLTVSQNGQPIRDTDTTELIQLGYTIEPKGRCAFRATYQTVSYWVRCDRPAASLVVGGSAVSKQPQAAPAAEEPDMPESGNDQLASGSDGTH